MHIGAERILITLLSAKMYIFDAGARTNVACQHWCHAVITSSWSCVGNILLADANFESPDQSLVSYMCSLIKISGVLYVRISKYIVGVIGFI